MDIAAIGGLIGGAFLVAFAIIWEAHFDLSSLHAYLNGPGLLIIIGGTGGATLTGFSFKQLANIPQLLRIIFQEAETDPVGVVKTMVEYAGKARREGLLGLEEDINEIEDPFSKKGLQLVVDGTDMEMIREILETDLSYMETRHKTGAEIFTAAGGYAPTMGIIGAVAGLIAAMSKMNDPSKLTSAIAVAFVATFYGIGFANLIFLPLATKLQEKSKEEVFEKELQIVGILSISAGDNPRIVEEKMKAFLAPGLRKQLASEGGADEA